MNAHLPLSYVFTEILLIFILPDHVHILLSTFLLSSPLFTLQ
uniref:Uncharacterized protein n=1 Tax=Rhizophora mucronata TaxID=61149 RepID=A0A2P2Q0I2_RHIMU